MCRSPIIQIKAQRSGLDLRRKKEIAECSFCRKAEAERCKLLLTRRKHAAARAVHEPEREAVTRGSVLSAVLRRAKSRLEG